MITDQNNLLDVVMDYLNSSDENVNFTIDQETEAYARGTVGSIKFFAIKINDNWFILEMTEGNIDCQKIMDSNFPAQMVPECFDTPVENAGSTDQDALNLKDAIRAQINQNIEDNQINISTQTDSHARGSVENGYFLAAKVNGQWQIIADGQGALDCPLIGSYNFPAEMIPECN